MFNKDAALIMDVAEGTYGQLYDHFGTKEATSQVLCLARILLITHIHGDHAFGIYKILLERDRALQNIPEDERKTIYCVIPSLMIQSIVYFLEHQVALPGLIKLIPSSECNPEAQRWYAHLHKDVDPSVPYEERKNNNEEICPQVSTDEIKSRIATFNGASNPLVNEMFAVMTETLGYEKLCMVEVNHCAEAYCAVLVSATHGNVLYSGDTVPCNNLKNYAQTAKVLIHEATLQVGMEEDAARKRHSTTG